MKNEDLEKRLENAEKAIMALTALIEGSLPAEMQVAVTRMMDDYCNSAISFGSRAMIDIDFKHKGH